MRRAFLIAAAGLLCLSGCGEQRPPTLDEAKAVVMAYVEATEARDRARIAALVTPGNEASGEIATRLARHGGRPADRSVISYSQDFGGKVTDAVITDPTGPKSTSREELLLVAQDGRWHIAFGQAPRDPSDPPRSSTEPLATEP